MKKGFEKRAGKYAKALLESLSPADFRSTVDELFAISTVFSDPSNKDAISSLINPVVAVSKKQEIVSAALGSAVNASVKNVVLLLVERGALELILSVTTHFEALVNAFEKASELHITSAKPLSESEQQAFQTSVKDELGGLGALVQFNFADDPGLLGGIQIRTGDTLLDSSLRGAVDRIFEDLGKVDV